MGKTVTGWQVDRGKNSTSPRFPAEHAAGGSTSRFFFFTFQTCQTTISFYSRTFLGMRRYFCGVSTYVFEGLHINNLVVFREGRSRVSTKEKAGATSSSITAAKVCFFAEKQGGTGREQRCGGSPLVLRVQRHQPYCKLELRRLYLLLLSAQAQSAALWATQPGIARTLPHRQKHRGATTVMSAEPVLSVVLAHGAATPPVAPPPSW